jgi:hypothetical protein
MASLPIYLPQFTTDPGVDLASIDKEEWLTAELQEEIMGHYPQPNDINVGDQTRSKDLFSIHCATLFPPDRKFASYLQLKAAVELFLKAWGASGSHGSSRISCFYGKPSKKLTPSGVEIDKQRIRGASLKEQQ